MTVEAQSPTELVDLRAPATPLGPHPWPTAWDAPATVPAPLPMPPPARSALRRRRLVVVAVLAGLIGLVAADFVIGRVTHDQHQRHLAAAMQTPSPHPVDGDPVLLVQIPTIDLNQIVVKGTGAAQLRGGPGLVDRGATPGRRGTAVIIGHRYRYGGPFNKLHTLQPGNEALVVQSDKILLHYVVTKVARVPAGSRPTTSPTSNDLLLVTDAGGLWPDKLLVVTMKPGVAPTAGRPPARPVPLAAAGSSLGLGLVLLLAFALVAGLVFGARFLRHHYRSGTVLAVLVPVAGLALIVVVMSLDLALSAAY